MSDWTRIPCDIPKEMDREKIVSILAECGVEVRIVRIKIGNRICRFIEFREQPALLEATQ